MIQRWTMATLSPAALGMILGLKTSWVSSSSLQARLLQLKCRLQHIRQIADQLAAAGKLIDSDDLVFFTLGELGPEYEPLAMALIQCSSRKNIGCPSPLKCRLWAFPLPLHRQTLPPGPPTCVAKGEVAARDVSVVAGVAIILVDAPRRPPLSRFLVQPMLPRLITVPTASFAPSVVTWSIPVTTGLISRSSPMLLLPPTAPTPLMPAMRLYGSPTPAAQITSLTTHHQPSRSDPTSGLSSNWM